VRSKGLIFTRHGTTDIGLKHINATRKIASDRVFTANLNAANLNEVQVAAAAAA
jgi:hypothetical protein